MRNQLAMPSLLFCACVSIAAGQSYDPRTGVIEWPADPVAPASHAQCDKLAQQWSQLSKQIEDAHQKCLDVHHGDHLACQSLHTAQIEINQNATERVQACRAEVAQSQKSQNLERQHEQQHEGRQVTGQEKAQDLIKQQALQLQQTRPEAAEKISAVLASNQNALERNLNSIRQSQAAALAASPSGMASPPVPGALPAGAASPSVASMTSGQLQVLQGLVMANSTDGSGGDANSAALVSALQQMGGQGNPIQQTADQQTAAILAIGKANDAARKGGAVQGHPAQPQKTAPQEMGTGNTTPGHGTSSVPATPAAERSNTVSATGGTDWRSDNVSSRSLNPGTQQGFASPTVGLPRQMFVAFAFSPLGLHGFGGDGAWGIGIDHDEQKAMDQSGANCALGSQAPDWCGTANGGHYEVCHPDGKTRYVALATNNDGDSMDWSDGEAIGALSEDEAIKSALANCRRSGCQLQRSFAISCTNDGASGSDGAFGGGVSPKKENRGSYAPSIDASCIHQFWDSTLYYWFAFRNDCGRPVHITFIALSPNDHFGASAADIDSGKSANTGWSKSEVEAKGGGFDVYVCPVGYIAVDATTGEAIDKTNVKFICKKL